jgi:hypothetical protein
MCSGKLYYTSCRMSCSWLRVDGWENVLLPLLCTTDHSGSIMLKSGECAGQGRCWRASSCSSNQDWTLLVVCMDEL